MAAAPLGLIGLGLLGTALLERFLASGFRVVGFDVNAAARDRASSLGAEVVPSAGAVADQCRRIVLSLPDSNIARTVVDEIATRLKPGTTLIDTTTGDPDVMAALGARLAERQIDYLDATVAGSSAQARQKDVIVMVGGDETAFHQCSDVFDSFARGTFYLGPSGSGARMKLVVNLVLGLNRAALAEGLAFARAMKIDGAQALKVLEAGPAASAVMQAKGRKMLEGDFTPVARLSQHLKDVRLILEQAEKRGIALPLSAQHRELLERLERAGYGDCDNAGIIKAYD